MNPPSTLAARLQQPKIRSTLLIVAEVLILVAAVSALLAILFPGPFHLMLFIFVGQPLVVIGIVLYLGIAITDFLRRRGVAQVHFAAGELVFRQGDPGDFVYVITAGEVEVSQENPEGKETILTKLGPGQHFGELALISDAPRTATVRALTPVDAVTLARTDFVNLYAYVPDLWRAIEKTKRRYK